MIPPWLPMAKYVELDTVTHVAGVIVGVRGRRIQRCCICGDKLADTEDQALPTFWGEGEIVRIKGGRLRGSGNDLYSLKRIPLDFCIELVER